MGGLARRVSYIKAFKYRSNGEVPALYVDAGNLFTDDKFVNGSLPVETVAKNKWVLKAYGDMHHDAANISYVDLPYLTDLLKTDGYDDRVKEYPFIKRLISANVKPTDDAHKAPTPYTIRELSLKRGAAGKKMKIGIVGFTEAKMGMGQPQPIYGGYRVDDPFQAAKNILPEIKQKVDFIIVLAYMSEADAQRLATDNPEIDTLIFGKHAAGMGEPSHFNRATVTGAYDQTKFMGELRVYVKGDGAIENQINRYVGLDSALPDDAEALTMTTSAHEEFTNEQNKAAKSNVQATNLLATNDSPFVGGQKCATCHQEENAIWEKTGHAHAMATLENKNQQFDNECVKCHVVGFGQGGFQSLNSTPQFANVQCESCHGPGKSHVDKPQKGYGFVQTPTGCVQCHTQMNSPDFNFKTYWPKIKHGSRDLAKAF